MKYSRKKLIDKAKAKIKALTKLCEEQRAKDIEACEAFKEKRIAATELYLDQLKQWKPDPSVLVPHLENTYPPQPHSSHGIELQRSELQRFIAQLELSEEETITFRSQYDMQLLDRILN